MTHREQVKYFEALKRYERKFEPGEYEDYKILLQRHKDDEDLDKLSFDRLKNLYTKYYLKREKKSFDDFFKKSDDKEDKDN